jgi:hypothetical protein
MHPYTVEFRSLAADAPALPRSFEGYLFNEPAHARQQVADDATVGYLIDTVRGTLAGRLVLFVRDGEARSPSQATFGGVEYADGVPPAALHALLDGAETFARRRGLSRLRLAQWPAAYAPSTYDSLSEVLRARGYRPAVVELNQHLTIRPGAFESGLHPSARRRLRKAQEAGLRADAWPQPDWAAVHAFVAAARQRKGYPMTLTAAALGTLGRRFPDEFRVVAAWDGPTLAALTVVVRLNARVLYTFYPADAEAYLPYSPTILTTAYLYNYAQRAGYGLIDLGISSVGGVPNAGLIRFKANLGAESSEKVTFVKDFLPI